MPRIKNELALFGFLCFALLSANFGFAQHATEAEASNARSEFSGAISDLQLDEAQQLDLESALKEQDLKRAETLLVSEAERVPKSKRTAKILTFVAALFFRDGQYLNSAIAWKRAEAITPLEDPDRFTLAMAYVRLNRRDWAREELERLSSSKPQNPLYLYWIARLDYDAQDYKEAIVRLKKVVALDPTMVRAYDHLGLCYDYLGQPQDAIHNYTRAVELNRQQQEPSPWPHVDLAITLIEVNETRLAEQHLREALRYNPRFPQAYYHLGRLQEMQGDYKAAAESLKQATALDVNYPEPHLLLGRIYHRLGDAKQAEAEITRFQQLRSASALPAVPKP